MGRRQGVPWLPNYINSIMYPSFCQFSEKVVLRLSAHGDVIETQTIRIVPPKIFQQTRSQPHTVSIVTAQSEIRATL